MESLDEILPFWSKYWLHVAVFAILVVQLLKRIGGQSKTTENNRKPIESEDDLREDDNNDGE